MQSRKFTSSGSGLGKAIRKAEKQLQRNDRKPTAAKKVKPIKPPDRNQLRLL
jgi:hypothetical protein